MCSLPKIDEIPKCSTHPTANGEVYCTDCKKTCCTECVVVTHIRHRLLMYKDFTATQVSLRHEKTSTFTHSLLVKNDKKSQMIL